MVSDSNIMALPVSWQKGSSLDVLYCIVAISHMSRFTVLEFWTIYERPSDHPDKFVVRRCEVKAPGLIVHDAHCTTHDTLEAARAAVPPGLYNLGRQPGDDPVIKETWL